MNGPIFASKLLELQPMAKVVGDVSYRSLELHQGALVTGQLIPQTDMKEMIESKKPTLQITSKDKDEAKKS
mgnify:FL=1